MYYNYEYKKDIDTRNSKPLYVLKLKEHLQAEELRQVGEKLKSLGFSYSKFKKGFITYDTINQDDLNNVLLKNNISSRPFLNSNDVQNIDILNFCENNNIETRKVGSYYQLVLHDSLMINPQNNTFFWYSREKGGSIIQFVQEYYNIDYYDSLSKLHEYIGNNPSVFQNMYHNISNNKDNISIDKDINLDELKNDLDEVKQVNKIYSYLIYTRKIDKEVVREFLKEKLISQDSKGNINFKAYDSDKQVIFNQKKGTGYTPYTGINTNSKNVCFSFEKINNPTEKKNIYIFESAIDLMSYYSLYKNDFKDKNFTLLSMNGLKINTIHSYLNEQDISNINSITIATDNDSPGIMFAEKIAGYIKENYNIEVQKHIPTNVKDWNDFLIDYVTDLEIKKTIKEIKELNEYAINILCDKDKLNEFMTFSQKFLQYSDSNKLKIFRQKPDAEFVATKQYYKNNKWDLIDTKPITIKAGITTKYYEENSIRVYLYSDEALAKAINENKDIKENLYFKDIYVYDIKQTNCPLDVYPELSSSKVLYSNKNIDYDETFINFC